MKKIYIFMILITINVVITSRLNRIHAENKLHVIASFSTGISHQAAGVKHNIQLASSKIDSVIIQPGKIFSFNAIVGEGNAQNGYVDGRVLYQDRTVMEPGGGICQVSSTVFNALLLAGCRIVERHRHYQPVTYVPLGLDATIKYGKKNLRIKNPYSFPLHMYTSINDNSLLIVVKSRRKLAYRYEMHTDEDIINIPFTRDKENIRQGISVYVYRKKYKGAKFIESFLLYKDYYPPVYYK